MVIISPRKHRVVGAFPTGIFMAYKWGLPLTIPGMILQVGRNDDSNLLKHVFFFPIFSDCKTSIDIMEIFGELIFPTCGIVVPDAFFVWHVATGFF